MSAESGKVCCNCQHCERIWQDDNYCLCYCEIDKHYLSYIQVMEFWCKHWATDEKKWKEVE